MNELISVIVPVYKAAATLPRCVESLLTQQWANLEIILVDDHSPDESPAVCDALAQRDKRIRVVHKPQNEGAGMARNTGLEAATGDYVGFVDADDHVDADMYGRLHEALVRHDADMAACGYRYETADGKVLATHVDFPDEHVMSADRWKEVAYAMLADGKYRPAIAGTVWQALYRREVVLTHDVRFPSERDMLSEDLIFNLRLLPHLRRIVFVPFMPYHYQYSPTGLASAMHIDQFEAWKRRRVYLLGLVDNDAEWQGRVDEQSFTYFCFHLLQLCRSQRLTPAEKRQALSRLTADPVWGQMEPNVVLRRQRLFFRLMYFLIHIRRGVWIWPAYRLLRRHIGL